MREGDKEKRKGGKTREGDVRTERDTKKDETRERMEEMDEEEEEERKGKG